MKNTYPDYYEEFSCVAGKCEATCCAGWQIVVDEASLKKYAKVNNDFSERIRAGVDFSEGVFCQKENKRCAFLNERNLCDMYTALGEDALCETCTRYPRHIEEFENVREYTLSVSCPEVARILLGRKEPVRFLETYEESEDEVFDDFDPLLYEVLTVAREKMLHVLQDRSCSVAKRAACIWHFVTEFQNKMDEGTLYLDEGLFSVCDTAGKIGENETVADFERAVGLFSLLFNLELLSEEWGEEIQKAKHMLYEEGESAYVLKKEEYRAWRKTHLPDWEIMAEQLMVYFLSTYFCGAVYDEYVASKVKLSVLSVFYLDEILTAQWLQQKKTLDFCDVVRVTYRFSRELEHSDENLCEMDRMLEEL